MMHRQAQVLRDCLIPGPDAPGSAPFSAAHNEEHLRAFFEDTWDHVLVPLAGASPHANERLNFVLCQVSADDPASEYRFQGGLGFGGKFRVRIDAPNEVRFTVDCYREDETAERLAAIASTNAGLQAFRDQWFKPHAQAAA